LEDEAVGVVGDGHDRAQRQRRGEPAADHGRQLLVEQADRLVGMFVANDRRMRALAPRQIDDAAAINQLGVRLDAYARIEVPTVLLGGDRSPGAPGRPDQLAHVVEGLAAGVSGMDLG
jgi:hypothetical protein